MSIDMKPHIMMIDEKKWKRSSFKKKIFTFKKKMSAWDDNDDDDDELWMSKPSQIVKKNQKQSSPSKSKSKSKSNSDSDSHSHSHSDSKSDSKSKSKSKSKGRVYPLFVRHLFNQKFIFKHDSFCGQVKLLNKQKQVRKIFKILNGSDRHVCHLCYELDKILDKKDHQKPSTVMMSVKKQPHMIAKVVHIHNKNELDQFHMETKHTIIAGHLGIGPNVFDVGICSSTYNTHDQVGIMMMQKLTYTFADWFNSFMNISSTSKQHNIIDELYNQLRQSLELIHPYEIVHLDILPKNIMFDENWKPYLIDWENTYGEFRSYLIQSDFDQLTEMIDSMIAFLPLYHHQTKKWKGKQVEILLSRFESKQVLFQKQTSIPEKIHQLTQILTF